MGLYMETLIEKKDIGRLLEALEDEDIDFRNKAVIALGELGDVTAVKHLIGNLNDESSHISKNAFDAILKIGNPAVNPLIIALNDENATIRSKAVLALGEIGDKSSVEHLIKCLNDESSGVRNNAAIALGNIGDERALFYLDQSLEDTNGHVRDKALKSIEKIKSNPNRGRLVSSYLKMRVFTKKLFEKINTLYFKSS